MFFPQSSSPAYWLIAALLSLAGLPAAAQTATSTVDAGPCQSLLLGSLDGHEGFRYPAWNSAGFNPVNNQQSAALLSERDSSGAVHRHLYTLDLATGQKKRLLRDVGCSLSWSRRGWIVLERTGQLWKIKANGDSLTQLTNTLATARRQPAWNPSGQRLACLQLDSSLARTAIIVLSAQGKVVGRVPSTGLDITGGPSWSPDGRKLAFIGTPTTARADNLYEFDFSTNKVRLLCQLAARPQRGSVHWLPNGREIVWRTVLNGLTLINLSTGEQLLAWQRAGILSLDIAHKSSRALVVLSSTLLSDKSSMKVLYFDTKVATATIKGQHAKIAPGK